jgi:hypothetical protein
MKENSENRQAFDALVKQTQAENQHTEPDVGHQCFVGCLGGSVLGFALSIVLFFILLVLDQNYSKPTDRDFANPIGVILFVFLATLAGGLLGTILYPFFTALFKRAREHRHK